MKAGWARCGPVKSCAPALLAAVLLLAPVASAAGVPVGAREANRALRFWTPSRMRAARPLEFSPQGRREAGKRASKAGAVDFESVAEPASPSMRRNGVIFFIAGGYPARCSGTSVQAPNRSLVFTAGHCVDDGGGPHNWSDRFWIFVPGYRYGQRPFGVFPAQRIDATREWVSRGSEDADVGAAVVGRNESGELLQDAVGGDRVAWNLPARQRFEVHGYPAAPPFNGETQRRCVDTPFLGHDLLSFIEPGPLNLAVSCNVTGGASGGGWTIDGNVLDGVTDYGYPEDPLTDFGSYFGTEVGRLYGRMSR
jgi:V8-like Glu-specific endopeptidase